MKIAELPIKLQSLAYLDPTDPALRLHLQQYFQRSFPEIRSLLGLANILNGFTSSTPIRSVKEVLHQISLPPAFYCLPMWVQFSLKDKVTLRLILDEKLDTKLQELGLPLFLRQYHTRAFANMIWDLKNVNVRSILSIGTEWESNDMKVALAPMSVPMGVTLLHSDGLSSIENLKSIKHIRKSKTNVTDSTDAVQDKRSETAATA